MSSDSSSESDVESDDVTSPSVLYSITPHHPSLPSHSHPEPSCFNLVSPCPNLSLPLLHILSSSPHHSPSTLFPMFSPHSPFKTFHHPHPAPRRRTKRKLANYMLSKLFQCEEQSILRTIIQSQEVKRGRVKCGNFPPPSPVCVDYSASLIQSHVSYQQLTS